MRLSNLNIFKRLGLGFGLLSAILLVAVLNTVNKVENIKSDIDLVNSQQLPNVEAAHKMVAAINDAIASLRGWLVTGDLSFISERAVAWEIIDRLEGEIEHLSRNWENLNQIQAWLKFRQNLTKFRQIQQQIELVAHSADEQPAITLMRTKAEPQFLLMSHALERLQDEGADRINNAGNKDELLQLLKFKDTVTDLIHIADQSEYLLADYLLTGDVQKNSRFEKVWAYSDRLFGQLYEQAPRFNTREAIAFSQLDLARQILRPLSQEIFDIRSSAKWNMANYLMISESTPIVDELLSFFEGVKDNTGHRSNDQFLHYGSDVLGQGVNKSAEAISQLINTQWMTLILGILFALTVAFIIGRSIIKPINQITETISALADGNTSVKIPHTDRKDEVGVLARAATVFGNYLSDSEQTAQQKTSISNISQKVQKTETIEEFANTCITDLIPETGCQYGVFYVLDESTQLLTLKASYGHYERNVLNKTIALGEGIAGQAALEKKPIVLTDIPQGHSKISSATSSMTPQSIAAYPLLHKEKLLGIIELASVHEFKNKHREYMSDLLENLSLNLENQQRMIESRTLILEMQTKTQELQASEEELRASEEELRASEEELRASNSELESNSSLLEIRATELLQAEKKQREINQALVQQATRTEAKQKELQAALIEVEEKSRLIEESSRYKSEFLANMSHELRTPLNSMLILSKSLADNYDGDLNSENVEAAKIIHDGSTSLLGLINNILDLSKIEAGKMVAHRAEAPIADIIGLVVRQYNHVAEEKGLLLQYKISDDVPKQIQTDDAKLNQILANLVSNALKFTETGTVNITVNSPTDEEISNLSVDIIDPIIFSVQDSGIGIAEEKLESVFESFTQADGSTSRRYGGTGLGLSICRTLAALLGGVIKLSSKVGKGSTFKLFLPALMPSTISRNALSHDPINSQIGTFEAFATNPEQDQQAVIEADRHEAQAVPLPLASFFGDDRDQIEEGEKVLLIIEDDIAFGSVLLKQAREHGFKTIYSSTGLEGINLAGIFMPVGILLDLGLPDIDGEEVINALKSDEKTRDIPIHILTGESDIADKLQHSSVGFLQKPVSTKQVDHVLRNMGLNADNPENKLLIVEDDDSSREAMRRLISRQGIQIQCVASGEDALKVIEEDHFSCIILDLGLPGMDGFEFLDKLADIKGNSMPAIVIHSGRLLSEKETMRLSNFTDSIIVKSSRASERLLDDVTLFMHKVSPDGFETKEVVEDTEYEVLKRKTVLVVDDDMRNTFALSRTLREKSLHVLMAKDGNKALEQLQNNENNIDIVLMDIMMPEMDGYETMSKIRELKAYKNIPIIALTAKAMQSDREKALKAGANEYLPKPIEISKLQQVMAKLLEQQ